MSKKKKKRKQKQEKSALLSFLRIAGYLVSGFFIMIFLGGVLVAIFDEDPDLRVMDKAYAEQKNKPIEDHPSKVLVLGEFEPAGTYALDLYVGNYNSKTFNGTLTVYINYEKEKVMKKVLKLEDIEPGEKEWVDSVDTKVWEENWIDISKFNYTYEIEGDFSVQ